MLANSFFPAGPSFLFHPGETLTDTTPQDENQPPDSSAEPIEKTYSPYAQVNPDQVLEPEDAMPEAKLEDLPESVQIAARRVGWSSLTPVQAKVMPYMLERRDLMVQSRTGSGKTGAFLLPVLAELDPEHPYCQAIILVPTRELALQVQHEAELLGAETGLRSIAVYGGVGYGAQMDAFKQGAHLVVGTPGRVLDHLMRGSLDLEDLEYIVFDEADRMMSMGFYPDMKAIRRYLPKRRSGFMFSATFPPQVKGLAREFLHEPAFLSLSHGNVHISSMDHVYYEVPGMEKDRVLARIIELENPPAAIIFCNTKQRVAYVSAVLQRFGYDADQLTADLSQKDRERVLTRVRNKSLRFLVATDVAARGIDISHLTHVFLYEFPDDLESYIHRAGRTGRAGAAGVCVSLVSYQELAELHLVQKRFGIQMEKREIPSEEYVSQIVTERTTALLEQKLRDRDRLATERMQRFIPLAKSLVESNDEASVIAMLLDDFYHASLHATVEIPSDEEPVVASQPRSQAEQSGSRSGREGRSGRDSRSGGRGPRSSGGSQDSKPAGGEKSGSSRPRRRRSKPQGS
jgi:ATP-dependent RNA helicase DeaD